MWCVTDRTDVQSILNTLVWDSLTLAQLLVMLGMVLVSPCSVVSCNLLVGMGLAKRTITFRTTDLEGQEG